MENTTTRAYGIVTVSDFLEMFYGINADVAKGDIIVEKDHVAGTVDGGNGCIYGTSVYFNGHMTVSIMNFNTKKFTAHHYGNDYSEVVTTIETL